MAAHRLPVACLLLLFTASAGAQHFLLRNFAGSYAHGDGGPALGALFELPQDVAVDSRGNVYVADSGAGKIRRIAPDGTISTYADLTAGSVAIAPGDQVLAAVAGAIVRVNADGTMARVAGTGRTGFSGNGGPALEADMEPSRLTVGADGAIYLAETNLHTVRKVSPNGVITLVAGSPRQAGEGGDNGPSEAARLRVPSDVAVDAAGNLYIADASNLRIRKVAPDGTITTVAGGACCEIAFGSRAFGAPIGEMRGLAVAGNGALYWTTGNHYVVTMGPDGVLRLVAGRGEPGYSGDGRPGRTATLNAPLGIALDASGAVWIAEARSQRIRLVTPEGVVRTAAGRGHYAGDGGPAAAALLNVPTHLARDAAGNLYFSDSGNHAIRRVSPAGVITTIAGLGVSGFGGDGRPATGAALNSPGAMAFDGEGGLVFADRGNLRLRRIRPDGAMETLAGTGNFGGGGDGGAARSAEFGAIAGVAVAGNGRIFVSDSDAHRIRVIAPDGTIRAFAGSGVAGFSGDGGPALEARLNRPDAVFVDDQNNVYISDSFNQRIRRVAPDGAITTMVGGGASPVSLDGSPALSVAIPNPNALSLDRARNLWFTAGDAVYRVTPEGVVFMVAGGGVRDPGFRLTEDTPARGAFLGFPEDVLADDGGALYVTAPGLHRIVRLVPNDPARLEIAGGDRQTGPAGRQLPEPLRVRILGASGAPVAGIAVRFTVTSGDAALIVAISRTGADGVAEAPLQFGARAGEVRVTAASPGLPEVTFTLTATEGVGSPSGGTGPVVNGVAGAGASSPAVTAVSPNMIVSIYGSGFAPEGSFREAGIFDLEGARLPRRLAGACVEFADQRAPVLLVTPGQINAIVPALQAGESVPVRVIVGCGSNEVSSAPVNVPVRAASPEWFYSARLSDGRNFIAAVNAATGRLIAPPDLLTEAGAGPAKPGDVVTLFGAGFGSTDPAPPPGEILQNAVPLAAPATLTLDRAPLDSADVLYVGGAPFLAGVYQANLRLPDSLEDGDYELRIRTGGQESPAGYLAVRR